MAAFIPNRRSTKSEMRAALEKALDGCNVVTIDGPSCTGKTGLLKSAEKRLEALGFHFLSIKKLANTHREDINETTSGKAAWANASAYMDAAVDAVCSRSQVSNIVYYLIGYMYHLLAKVLAKDEWGDAETALMWKHANIYNFKKCVAALQGNAKPLIVLYDDEDAHVARKKGRGQPKDAKTMAKPYLVAEKMVFSICVQTFDWPFIVCPNDPAEFPDYVQDFAEVLLELVQEKGEVYDCYGIRNYEPEHTKEELAAYKTAVQRFAPTAEIIAKMPR